MRYFNYAAKAIYASAVYFAGTFAAASPNISGTEWVTICLGTVVAGLGTFGISNGSKP